MNNSDMPKYSVSPSKGLMIYFLFLFGGIIAGMIVAGGLSVFIIGNDTAFVQKVMNNLVEYPEYFHEVMAINTVSLIFMLLLPSLLFLKLFEIKIEGFSLNEPQNINYLLMLQFAGLLIFTVQPLVGWSGELNKLVVLPDAFASLELLAKETDAKYVEIFGLIKNMTSYKDLTLLILFLCVAPAIIEELVFRGVIQNLLRKTWANQHLAVWASALLFSLMHVSLYGFLPRLLLGVLLGYTYLYSGKFIISVFTHFVNNLFVVLVLFFAPSQEESLDNPPMMFSVLATIAFAFVGYYFIRLSKVKANE